MLLLSLETETSNAFTLALVIIALVVMGTSAIMLFVVAPIVTLITKLRRSKKPYEPVQSSTEIKFPFYGPQ